MTHRCTRLLGAAASLALLALPACGKSDSKGGAGGGSGSGMRPPAVEDGGPARRRARERPAPRDRDPPMRAANVVSSGPTGLAECDLTLEVVCRCAGTQASLQTPCKTLRDDAPGWKVRAQGQTPSQLDDLRKSCKRILASVEAAYGCK